MRLYSIISGQIQRTIIKENEAPNTYHQQLQAYATSLTHDNNVIKELREQVKKLQQQNALLLKTISTLSSSNNHNPKDPITWKYYHTHGANATHESKDCLFLFPNYKVDATFKDTKEELKLNFGRK